MLIMYGINNCDTIKKARYWLEENHINVTFHDYRVDGVTYELLIQLTQFAPWQELLNTRGTTLRKLTQEQKNTIIDKQSAINLMLEQPTIIKRPLLRSDDAVLVGFKINLYQHFFQR